MARKRKNDTAMIMGAIAAVVVVVVILIAVPIVRGLTAGEEDSSSSSFLSSSESSSSSMSSSSSSSSSSESAGPAGPVIPELSDENEESSEASSSESSSVVSSSSSSASSSSQPVSSSVKPSSSSSVAPVSSSAAPVSSSSTPPPSSSSPASSSTAAMTQLDTPVIEVGTDGGDLYVSWDLVDHASGYLVQLFDADDDSDALEEATLEKQEDVYYFETELDEDITYKIKVQALGSGSYYDSNRRVKTVSDVSSSSSSSGKKLNKPTNLEAYLDDGELTIEWDEVDDAISYTVELIKPNGKVVESDTTDGTGYVFDTELDEVGAYKVRICANPRKNSKYTSSDYVIKSVRTTSSTVGSSDRLAAPQISIRKYNDYLKITWDPVTNATEYYLEIIDPSGEIIHSTHLVAEESPYEYYGDMNDKGTYQIRMKAIDDEGDFKESTKATEKLTINSSSLKAPSILDVTTNRSSATVSFQPVDDAQYYQIQIYDGHDDLVNTVKHSPSGVGANKKLQTKKISGLDSNTEYRIRIRACSNDSDTEHSSWSDYYDFITD